ncbi:hypothetical protein FO519_001452 [Halicephalobus sp. NKZ332]|nr:hypothetical protein FO519_001452 [Halicephalobus sp. NKZ332]
MHSHVDPGWLSTFEEYFEQKVHSILNLTVHHLSKNPDMRFIWSEMSFLERWWRVADDDQKQKMRQIVKDRKLELTGGAWVMTDEATPFFWGTIDNMIEGHHFVKKTFNIVPTTSWSVDPFGHGLMIPYLLSESRISSMVIGRLDADLKAELRKKRLLLFNWAQPWDENGNSATPLVTALPRTYYTTADSCGTNPTVCCMFDLGPSARSYCTKRANDVNDANVDSYAKQLTDQYRQLSPFYLGNTVLVPVGDDFFFSKDADWTVTHSNYKKIFDYVNSNQQKFNMKVQFSTVEEYFQKVSEANVSFPLFTGDFFPYTEDKSGTYPYWTGFYVHMPFFKRAERLTEGKLRAIDFMSVLSNFADVTENIRPARRDLALCQHHDSITGTSKPHVMIDYQTRLRNAFSKFDEAMKEIVERKISPNAKSSSLLIFPQESPDGISNLNSIVFTSEKKSHDLLIFHQGSQYVKQKITLRVNDPRILVLQNENPIEAQILPVMNFKEGQISNSIYELVFFVQLGPFEAKNIHLDWILDQPKTTTPSMVFSSKSMNSSCFILMNLNSTKFSLSNRHFSVQFEDGLIASMKKAGENTSTVLQVTFKGYLDRGGAYTFVSNGPSSNMHRGQIQTVPFTPIFVVGPIVSKAITRTSASLFQTAIIDNGDALSDLGIHLELFSNQGDLDITQMMVIKTNIRNQDEFHTDVNGMYFLKRKINKEVAFEGNIYPVASSVFVEDEDSRLTVLSGQPTGATVDKNMLEIMLDRRLSGEDGKGLSRGDASHSPPSLLKFDLLFESKNSSSKDNYSVFFSSLSYFALQNLLYPPELLLLKEKQKETESWGNFKWSCNIELINIRYLDEQTGLILLRRLPFDQTLPQVKCLEDDFKNLYNGLLLFSKKTPLILTSLTGTVDESMIVDEKILENLLKVPLKILALKFILD